MKLTIKQAGKAGWPSRPTLYRAIKNGRLSAEKTPDGRTLIDSAELVRVYGEPVSKGAAPETAAPVVRITELQGEIGVLKERLASLEREKDSLTEAQKQAQEREQWLRGQLERTQALLPTSGNPGSLWGRLWGRGKA